MLIPLGLAEGGRLLAMWFLRFPNHSCGPLQRRRVTDRHGALVIPPEVVVDLEQAIIKLLETEKLTLEPARATGFDFDIFEKAWAAFEASWT